MLPRQGHVARCHEHERCARVTVPPGSWELSGVWHFRFVGNAWRISGPSEQELTVDLGQFEHPAAVLAGAIPGIVLSPVATKIADAARGLAS
jgi:hypothetical protein